MGLEGEERIRILEAEVRRFQQMLQCAPDFVSLITVDGRFLYINRLPPGVRLEDVVGTSMLTHVRPQFQELSRSAIRQAVETRKVQYYSTAGQITPSRMGHFFTRVSPIIENDEVTSLVMIATEISSIEEQRVLLQVALDSTGMGTWSHNPSLGTATWDEAARRILSLTADVTCSFEDVLAQRVHPDDRTAVATALARAFTSGRYGPVELRIVMPRGEARWVSMSALSTRDSNGHVVTLVGSIADITDRKMFEARLLQAQKLESVGRLAGGVAHDFNNLLTAILINVDFALEAESLSQVHPLLDAIRLAGERSAALTSQLLSFARRQVIEPKVVDPNAAIGRLDTLFKRTVGEHIRTVLSLAALGHIKVDESQFEQVVLNLIANARDAMPEGGVLTVETLDVELDDAYAARQPDVKPGRYVMIAISDTGAGIAADVIPFVFEPFYTTRAGGTGLGLATCYGITKQSGGHIAVYSEPLRGSTFKVYLPRVDEAVSAKPVPSPPLMAALGERVLFVEDEPSVRAVVERTLVKNGYEVVSAANAEEALRIAETEGPFELLLTDVILPGMNGCNLAERLKVVRPQLPVLYISGYTENAIVHGGVLDPGINFLQKPFLTSELLVAVRKALVKG
jgi:two-component system, cell cycle sensor histidine kinase and response regulator CckA